MFTILGMEVPEPIEFLNWGWWIIHVVAITMVFLIGMAAGKSKCRKTHADTRSAAR